MQLIAILYVDTFSCLQINSKPELALSIFKLMLKLQYTLKDK